MPEIGERYSIGETIGEGTFGKVKRGVHRLSGVDVAVKILEKARIVEPADVERVEREIYILKSISHRNVVRLLEVVDASEHIFLVMEYAEGGELFDYIVDRVRVDELDACRVFHELLNGVDYCHLRGIVHRDLKPENLLLDGDGRIKVVDFGLGNVADGPDRMMDTACGSPCYAAPEMIAGHRYHGPTADLWSAGVILYALVCGWLPFEDPSTACLYDKILSASYTVPSFVSAPCRDLIRRMLTTDPRKRITAEQIRSHPWYTLVEVDTDPADPAGEPPTGDRETVFVQQDIVEHMGKLGYDTDDVLESLRYNRHDEAAATYAFLEEFKRRKREEMAQRRAAERMRRLGGGGGGAAVEGTAAPAAVEGAARMLEEDEVEVEVEVPAPVPAAEGVVTAAADDDDDDDNNNSNNKDGDDDDDDEMDEAAAEIEVAPAEHATPPAVPGVNLAVAEALQLLDEASSSSGEEEAEAGEPAGTAKPEAAAKAAPETKPAPQPGKAPRSPPPPAAARTRGRSRVARAQHTPASTYGLANDWVNRVLGRPGTGASAAAAASAEASAAASAAGAGSAATRHRSTPRGRARPSPRVASPRRPVASRRKTLPAASRVPGASGAHTHRPRPPSRATSRGRRASAVTPRARPAAAAKSRRASGAHTSRRAAASPGAVPGGVPLWAAAKAAPPRPSPPPSSASARYGAGRVPSSARRRRSSAAWRRQSQTGRPSPPQQQSPQPQRPAEGAPDSGRVHNKGFVGRRRRLSSGAAPVPPGGAGRHMVPRPPPGRAGEQRAPAASKASAAAASRVATGEGAVVGALTGQTIRAGERRG